MSFYYIKQNVFEKIRDKSDLVVIDSGAHSFQKGKKVHWIDYTEQYAEWIQKNDCDKVLGYFEMDIDPAGYSYSYVKELRKILEKKSNKIIPVWHKNRGINDFKQMCKNPIHKDRIISITGFKNEDIKDEQYKNFVAYAHYHKCKVFCLGMTRRKLLNTVPFDFTDSSSWKQAGIYGRVGKHKVTKEFSKRNRPEVLLQSYKEFMKLQEKYR